MNEPTEAVLTVHGATKTIRLPSRQELTLLRAVDLTVAAGESVAVRGRSGSGKTTLLRALGLFIPFDGGTHRLLGMDVRAAGDLRCSRLRARSIGFVFQDFRLLPNLTAAQNVDYACILAGMRGRRRRAAVRDALDRVGLGDRAHNRPSQLSGGEQQRVSIARALVKEPALLLADEPTGALDGTTADAVMGLLLGAAAELRSALVLVTHDDRVAERCHRRVHLADGLLHTEAASTAAGGS
jgi:putative ABC transport system ATP-binding protein